MKKKNHLIKYYMYLGTLFVSASFRTGQIQHIHLHVYHITHLYTSLYFYNPNFNAILFCPHKNQCSLKIASEHAKRMPLLFIHSHHVILFELITEIRSQMIMIFLYLFFFTKIPKSFFIRLDFLLGCIVPTNIHIQIQYSHPFNVVLLIKSQVHDSDIIVCRHKSLL